MQEKKLTPKQYLKQHPEKYVIVGTVPDNYHDIKKRGKECFIAKFEPGMPLFGVELTLHAKSAEVWSSLDNTESKLNWHIVKTGIKDLHFVKIISLDQE